MKSKSVPLLCFPRWLTVFLSFALLVTAARAQTTTPLLNQLFTNNMVLQRDADAPVWGWTTVGNTVTVKIFDQASTLLQTKTAVATANGRWQVTVGPFAAVPGNAAYSMQVSAPGVTTNIRTNILIGDVFLCGGQSNMARGLSTIGVYDLNAEITDAANYPNIRHIAVPFVSSNTPRQTIGGTSWFVAGVGTGNGSTKDFSATGSFMAREIYKRQGVPIGLINAAYSGTEIKLWLDPDFVAGFADFGQPAYDQLGAATLNTYSGGYNGMIAPLAPFAIKAAIWYQGENNTTAPEQYSRLLPALISHWRTLFAQPALPFIVVQLTNTDTYAGLRDAQLNVVKNDPHARLVTTIDIGENQLHPRNKQDVGLRASWAARDLVYGESLVHQGPLFTTATVSGNTVRCAFSNVGAGLMVGLKSINATGPQTPTQQVANGTLAGFTIAGANQTFFAATAAIDAANNTVLVSSPSVSAPLYVRYAWANTTPAANLYNKITDTGGTVIDGLPASPFRTAPVYLLNVNQGTGTGLYALNATVPVTAASLPGQSFLSWSGDTASLSSSTTPSTTATVGQSYVSIRANYQVTGAPPGLSALTTKNGQVSLAWTALSGTHYNVKRATTFAGPYTIIAADLINTSRFIDFTATPGTAYHYVVSAQNPQGEGPDSTPVSITLPSALATTVQVTLAWAAPGIAPDSYTVKRATATGGPYTTLSSGSTARTFTDPGVVSATAYFYQVYAVTGGIETPLTPELSITPNFLPAPLQSLDLGKVGLNGGTSASTSGIYTLTGSGTGLGVEFDACHFAYFTTPLTGDFTVSARVATLGTTGSYPEAGLMLRSSLDDTAAYARIYTSSIYTSYQFRNPANSNIGYSAGDKTKRWIRLVRTANSCAGWISADGLTWTQQGGAVTLSGPVFVGLHVSSLNNAILHTSSFDNLTLTPDVALQIPATPLNLNLVPASSTSVTLAWSAASGASAYQVKRATTPDGPFTTVATGLNALSTSVTGLTASAPYYFTVSALNSAGESPDATAVSVNTLAAPTNLTAAALSETQLRLDWGNTPPAATALELQRSPAGVNLWTALTTTLAPTATTYTDATLQPSTAYDFRLRALDASTASPFVTLTNTSTPAGIGDGIPGAWRLQYFGNGLTLTAASAPAADPDGDGLNNLREYLAGTVPTDPASTLRLLGPTRSGDDYVLTFATVLGKTYRVEKTSTLAPAAWTSAQSPFAGTGETLTATDTNGAIASAIFYRLTVN